MRLGPWHVERTLARDHSGVYHVGSRDGGERATLYVPSGEIVTTRGEPLRRLLELHRDLAHDGMVGFRSLDHDSGDPFLVADPVAGAMASLRSGRRPAPGQTRAIGAALAAILAAAHERGLFHGGLELDNTLWAPGHGPQILGIGVGALGVTDPVALAHGDVVSLGRLLCALVASWAPRGAGPDWVAADGATVELVRMLADPSAAISMREAHALLGEGLSGAARLHGAAAAAPGAIASAPPSSGPDRAGLAVAPTEDYVPWGNTDASRTGLFRVEPPRDRNPGGDAAVTGVLPGPATQSERPSGYLGRYRILTRLGCGGMGEVFLAEDPTLRRGVAIKRIRAGLERDRAFRARLRREAQLAARLSHRAIVQVFDLITEDNVDHVVMEYVPGPSLHTLLAGNPMSVGEAVRIAAELADGLAHAHQLGIVHRDLKLENVLISIDGQPKIADFGIARRTTTTGEHPDHESVTRDGIVVGTSRAMSPEQIRGQDVDARSDLFSFGVLVYELVTGTSPFVTGVEAMTIVRVLNEPHVPARDVVAEVPRAVSDLIDHLLEKDPLQRPDSARTVRDRLRRMLDAPPDVRPRVADASGTDRHPASSMQLAAEPAAVTGDLWLGGSVTPLVERDRPGAAVAGAAARQHAGTALAAATGSGEHERSGARDQDLQRLLVSYRRDGQDDGQIVPLAGVRAIGQYPSAPRKLTSRIQAPFVLAEIRALRSSIFKRSPEIQSALAIADKVEHAYDLQRADLFIPAVETFCAILEPFAMTVLTGTLRRIGYEIFPQYVSILGIPAPEVKVAMNLRHATDLICRICDAYSKCVVGSDAGLLTPKVTGSRATVTDTTFMPCQLQMGVFLGAGKLTGLFRETALTEKRCRVRGDSVCTYEFAF
ncbi:MAG TPA: serine/threonine-protein kinase [Kofleriaceae bacterium]|nr:serine/threonine-protein kinase [Kofleriaceae bacterium]